MTEGRVKRNGNYFKDPYFGSEAGHPEEVEGEEDKIPTPELFEAPFVIIHNKGSVSNQYFIISVKFIIFKSNLLDH